MLGPDNALGRRSGDLTLHWAPLKGTSQEADELKRMLTEAKVFEGALATESVLKRAAGPRILHVATHGFFLSDQPSDLAESDDATLTTRGAPVGENPLLRSGLALAGANTHHGGNGEDGILTALEAAGLDLWGTKLVVLSACETGVGDTKSGDGVYGLRRSLVLAGAESQLMSLWRVDDKATRDLMVAYYKRLLASEGRSEALRQVQLDMLKRPTVEHPYYWAAFIPIGDWRNLKGEDR